jgi:pilus assembly protein CpaB
MRFGGLVAAIIVASIAAVIVLRMSENSAPAPSATPAAIQPAKTASIYVASQTIPVGSTITQEMVTTQPWPEHLVLQGFVKVGQPTDTVVGMIARAPFQQNEPIISSKIANPNDPNFLAGDLPAGMRVVTIPLNEVDGIAGFVFPGDHVDLIYTHDIERWVSAGDGNSTSAPQKQRDTVTETLLTNVKVLAVDQRSSSVGSTDKNGNLVIPRSASLMVSQSDSQRVRLAQKTGTVSLVLRSLADRESSDPMIVTEKKDISQNTTGAATASVDGSVKVLRGAPKTSKELESVGSVLNAGAPPAVGSAAPSNSGSVTAP